MECGTFDEADVLRQGDIFSWVQAVPPWRSVGIIVTGDCDMLTKHKPFLSYIPVVSIQEYLSLFLAHAEIIKATKVWANEIYGRIETLRQKYLPTSETFSREAVDSELIGRLSADEILQIINVTGADDANRFLAKAQQQLPLIQQAAKLNADSGFVLSAAMSFWHDILSINFSGKEQANNKLASKVRDHLASIPDDVFFIGEIPATMHLT
jgi:hypothetical protein